ncbi:hypothetical protein [Legionella fallonii]|uniref:Uncharacterized protein n=1 Tax=Legionella fallonii LLAP-10 TaxID=1212491 RepID=A0A098FZV2_9GAMM|nr:hypothetical protein [Legionella fallonii]CEG55762.1 protein of unknown function [coiled-coil domain] [Legionella fallonii LLAP-10]
MTDKIFIDYFKEHFIEHLKKPPNPHGSQNQARKIVQDAVSTNLGKLSRLFDTLVTPIVDRDVFIENLARAGNMDAYMRPILNDAAEILLNKNKTRLQDDVIKAIGLENYATLASGEIEHGIVVAKKGEEAVFAEKEAEIARVVLDSITVNYAQSLEQYQQSPKERAAAVQVERLHEKILQLQTATKDFVPRNNATTSPKSHISFTNIDELNQQVADKIQRIAAVLENKNSPPKELLTALAEASACREEAQLFLDTNLQYFLDKVMAPLNTLATNFKIEILQDPKPQPSLAVTQEKIATFNALVEQAQQVIRERSEQHIKENSIDSPLPHYLTSLRSRLGKLHDQLQSALYIPEAYPHLSADGMRDQMLNKYNAAVETFVEQVDVDLLKAEPPKPLMHIILRVLRAILIGSLTTAEEKADQERFTRESGLKNDLLDLREELRTPAEDNVVDNEHQEAEDKTVNLNIQC